MQRCIFAQSLFHTGWVMQVRNAFVAFLISLLFAGCASGYKQFYRPAQGINPERLASIRVGPAPTMPMVERAQPTDSQAVLDAYAKRGYLMIGSSMFNSGRNEPEDSAIDQAQKVGADLVLILDPRYTGSVTSTIPITTPTTSTSYSTGSATAYGTGQPVTVYGSGTTTTYGTQTTYVPMTVHRSDYGAVFFIKRRYLLGVLPRDLSDSERRELQSNKGVVVRLVVDNTPACNADILVGDIITTVDGVPVLNSNSLGDIQRERRGKRVVISILRGGQRIEKTVQLNP